MEWDDILILKYIESHKTLLRAINLKEILEVRADSKLVDTKMKREFTLVYRHGGEFTIPDDAVSVGGTPSHYRWLIDTMSKELAV